VRALVLVALLALTACSSSALRAHIYAGTTSRAALDLAADMGEAACSPTVSATMGAAGVSPEAHEQHVERCLAVKSSHKLAVTAWRGYLTAVLEAAAAERRPDIADVLQWARQLAQLYRGVSGALRELGVDAPRLPPVLDRLVGGEE